MLQEENILHIGSSQQGISPTRNVEVIENFRLRNLLESVGVGMVISKYGMFGGLGEKGFKLKIVRVENKVIN